MEYRIKVQCIEPTSGKVGTFIANEEGQAVSPRFAGLFELYPYMRENGWKSDEHPSGAFVPWRVVDTWNGGNRA